MICLCILWIPVLSVAEHTWIRESWTMSLAWSPWPWEDLVDEVTYLASNCGGGLPHGPGTWDWDCKLGSSTNQASWVGGTDPACSLHILFKLKGCASTLHLHWTCFSELGQGSSRNDQTKAQCNWFSTDCGSHWIQGSRYNWNTSEPESVLKLWW